MKFTTQIITAAGLIVLATTASFADDDNKFDGFYLGAETGIDWTKLATDGKRDRNIYYGGVIGMRRQLESGLVFGIEGTFGDNGYNNQQLGITTDYEWSAGLTVGTVFGDEGDNLVYGKAAYVQTRFATDLAKTNEGGWRFGGGYERSISDNVSLRLSGDYTAYGNDNGSWAVKSAFIFKF